MTKGKTVASAINFDDIDAEDDLEKRQRRERNPSLG
jgi:hypothetical protein